MSILTPLKKLWPRKRPIAIKRSRKRYISEQGWRLTSAHDGPRLEGWYRTRYGSYCGKIENLASSQPRFFIKQPPPELNYHEHRPCFTDRGSGWYSVHFSKPPEDLDSGVIEIERTLNEAFQLAQKAG